MSDVPFNLRFRPLTLCRNKCCTNANAQKFSEFQSVKKVLVLVIHIYYMVFYNKYIILLRESTGRKRIVCSHST